MSDEFIKIKVVGDAAQVKKAVKPITDLSKNLKNLNEEMKKMRKTLKDVAGSFSSITTAAKTAATAQTAAATATKHQSAEADKGTKKNKALAEAESMVAKSAKVAASAQSATAAATKSAGDAADKASRKFYSYAQSQAKNSKVARTENAKNKKEWEKSRSLIATNVGSDLVNKNWKSLNQVMASQVKLRRNLGDKAFISTQSSLAAAVYGGAGAMGRQLTKMEQYRIRAGVLRNQVMSLATAHQSLAKNMQWTGRQMMVGLSVPIAVFGQRALSAFMGLDRQLTRVAKVINDPSIRDAGSLGEAVKAARTLKQEAGAIATELAMEWGVAGDLVAGLMGDWAAMGYSMDKTISGLPAKADATNSALATISEGVLRVATLGEVDISDATNFYQSTLKVFGDEFDDAKNKAGGFNNEIEYTNALMNQFNAIENETILTLQDMSTELPELAQVFKATGISAGEGMSLLAGMKGAGIPVTEATTAIRNNVIRLLGPTKQAQKTMDELGFSMFNLDESSKPGLNSLISLAELTEGLTDKTKWEALRDFFGVRTTAKMQTLFEVIRKGKDQLKAFGDGTIDASQMNDFGRSLAAIGGTVIKGEVVFEADWTGLQEKADTELGILRDSSAFKFDQMKTGMKTIFQEIGGLIAPPIIAAMKWFEGLLQKIMALPHGMKMFIATIAAAAAAMGPLIFVFAQIGLAVMTMIKGMGYLLPKLVDIVPSHAEATGLLGDGNKNGKFGKFIQEKDTGRLTGHQNLLQKIRWRLHQLTAGYRETGVAAAAAARTVEEAGEDMDKSTKKVAGAADDIKDEVVDIADVVDDVDIDGKQLDLFADVDPDDIAQGKLFNDESFAVPPTVVAAGKKSAEDAVDAVDGAATKQAAAATAAGGSTGFLAGIKAKVGAGLGAMGTKLGVIFRPLTDVFAGLATTFAVLMAHLSSGGSRLVALRSVLGGLAVGFGNLAIAIGSVAGFFIKFIFFGSIIAMVIGAIIFLVKGLKDHWKDIQKAMAPAIEKLRKSFDYLKFTLQSLVQSMMNIMTKVGPSNSVLGESVDIWTAIGQAIGWVIERIADVVNCISWAVVRIWPLFELIAQGARYMTVAIKALLTGDVMTAMTAFFSAFFWMTKPIWTAAEFIVDKVVWMVTSVAQKLGDFVGNFNKDAGNAIKNWATNTMKKARDVNAVKEIQFLIESWSSDFKQYFVDVFAKKGEEAADELGPDTAEKLNSALGDALEEGADDVANDWLSSFLGGVKGSLDEILGRVRDAAKKAFDDYIGAQMKVYEDQIDAMDAVEEAERKLYATQEYLARKKELLRKHELDRENYKRDRALAIYEGRIDDARMLDRDWENSTYDFQDDLNDIEESRRKELLDDERQAQRDRIEAAKEARKEELEIMKEAFEKQLEMITEYTPRTVDEWNNMIGQISNLLQKQGVEVWPGMFQSGFEAFGEAIVDANEDIRQEAFWSGKDVASEWLRGFADLDVIALLMSDMSSAVSAASDSAVGDIGAIGDAISDVESNLGGDIADTGWGGEPETSSEPLDPNRARQKGVPTGWSKWTQDFQRGLQSIKEDFPKGWDKAFDMISDEWNGFLDNSDGEGAIRLDERTAAIVRNNNTIRAELDLTKQRIDDTLKGYIAEETVYPWSGWGESMGLEFEKFEVSLSAGWGRIQEFFSSNWNTFSTNFSNGWAELQEIGGSNVETLENQFSAGWERISTNVGNWMDTFTTNFGNGLSVIGEHVSSWLEDIGSWFNFAQIDWSDTWSAFGETFGSIWEGIEGAVKSPLNNIAGWIATAINWVIDGINGLGGAINGLSNAVGMGNLIPPIQRLNQQPTFLATGGQIPGSGVGNGFMTNGPRAIVGEGNAFYPEYVIPTDPKHRGNASALIQAAAKDVGLEAGGKIGKEMIGSEETIDPIQAAKDAAKAAARVAFSAAIPGIEGLINQSQMPLARTMGYKALKSATQWAFAKNGLGNVPFDNYPTMLHRNEMVLPAKIAENVREMSSGGGTTIIQVENFIGEEAWFNEMMKEHDIKVKPAQKRASGSQSRRVVGYNGGR